MRRFNLQVLLIMTAGIVLLLGGCASHHARSMDTKGTLLVDPYILTKGTGDQALYRYVNPKLDIRKYTKILIDPVIVIKSAELDAGERENYQRLATNAYLYLSEELSKDYLIVKTPDSGAMRIQMAIIDADASKPVRNLMSSVVPISIGISALKYVVTGKQSGVGEISGEFRITDATTGELLGAAVDRRVGGKAVQGVWDTWYNADEALKYWSRKGRYLLCNKRDGKDCENP